MKFPGLPSSPLAGTAAAWILLALLAIPLHRLTSSERSEPQPPPETTVHHDAATQAVLRIKLLAPAKSIRIGPPGSPPLLDLKDLPAGESEHDAPLPITEGVCELELAAGFERGLPETAVFLTVMPEGLEDKTLFVTGSGDLGDVLRFEWPHTHE